MSIRDMVARHSNYNETRDFIPTPPYVTRTFYRYLIPHLAGRLKDLTAWDPAAGRGHMVSVMKEMGHKEVIGTDIEPWEPADVTEENFLTSNRRADLIFTNPPYARLEEFINKCSSQADVGFGLLTRVQALETQGRYNRIFHKNPPSQIAFFSDRIPFKTGEVVRKAPKMFFHVWLWWEDGLQPQPPLWIPPDAQRRLEKDEDYDAN